MLYPQGKLYREYQSAVKVYPIWYAKKLVKKYDLPIFFYGNTCVYFNYELFRKKYNHFSILDKFFLKLSRWIGKNKK